MSVQGKGQAEAQGKPPPAGRLQAIMDTILGNLQVTISNMHIRYEVHLSPFWRSYAPCWLC